MVANKAKGKINSPLKEENDYCDECIFTWCSMKNEVTYCTQKVKGFFECESCMSKMITLYDEVVITSKEELIEAKVSLRV